MPNPSPLRFVRWALLALAGLAALWVADHAHQDRALAALAGDDRRALYTCTLEVLGRVCAPPSDARLEGFCAAQARTAVALPECDAPCRALAGRLLPHPTR